MKSRRVIVTIELTTDNSQAMLKAMYKLPFSTRENIHQVQVNVVKKEKK